MCCFVYVILVFCVFVPKQNVIYIKREYKYGSYPTLKISVLTKKTKFWPVIMYHLWLPEVIKNDVLGIIFLTAPS